MTQHGRENKSNRTSDARVDDAAARASQLVSARSAARRNAQRVEKRDERGARPSVRDSQPLSLFQFIRRYYVYILCVAAVSLLVAVGLVVLGSFITSDLDKEGTAPAYVSPYDWSKLDRSNGRYQYVVDGEVRSHVGIDVSDHQQTIDWSAVGADDIDFAMIRLGYRGATEGVLYLDEQYEANLAGARAAGVDCGVYFFSQATTTEEAVEEADYVLQHLNGSQLEYPIAFDLEEHVEGVDSPRTSGLSVSEATAIAEAFCSRVEEAGYRSIVYGNVRDLSRYSYEDMQRHDIWWAQYDVDVPVAGIDIIMWQYSHTGTVAGISTEVDMNIDLSDVLD